MAQSKNILFIGNFAVDYSSENHHAKTLEKLGHKVIRMQERDTSADDILNFLIKDEPVHMVLWIHTHGWETRGNTDAMFNLIKRLHIPLVTYHLDLWFGLEREQDIYTDPFYKHLDYFFTVDMAMAEWLNDNTQTKGIYMPAGVFEDEAYIHDSQHQLYDIVFVGSRGYHPEWQYRPQLIDWLKQTYGDRFTHVGGDGMKPTTRGDALNRLYKESKVVIGDTLCLDFSYPYYFSDRVFETTGRGGFIIHPRIHGLETMFEYGKEIETYEYGAFDELERKINHYLNNDAEREAIRMAGHERTKRDHTYTQRWRDIIDAIDWSDNAL